MFCDQCGNQIPDGSAICPVCGANLQQADEMKTVSFQAPPQPNMGFQPQPQAAPQPNMGGFQPQPQAAPQPNMGGFQPQPQAAPQPNMGGFQTAPQANMGFQGQPGYGGMPQPTSMSSMFKPQSGEDFPMCKKSFLKTLTMRGKMMNFIGIFCGLMIFICLFIPFATYKEKVEYGSTKYTIRGSASMLLPTMKYKAQGESKKGEELGYGGGWFIMIFSIGMIVAFVLRFDVIAFILSILNFAMLLSASGWFGGAIVNSEKVHFGAGFWLYLIFSLVLLASPFIWQIVVTSMQQPKAPKMNMGMQPMMGGMPPQQPMMGGMPPQQPMMGQMPPQQQPMMGGMPPQQRGF